MFQQIKCVLFIILNIHCCFQFGRWLQWKAETLNIHQSYNAVLFKNSPHQTRPQSNSSLEEAGERNKIKPFYYMTIYIFKIPQKKQ